MFYLFHLKNTEIILTSLNFRLKNDYLKSSGLFLDDVEIEDVDIFIRRKRWKNIPIVK